MLHARAPTAAVLVAVVAAAAACQRTDTASVAERLRRDFAGAHPVDAWPAGTLKELDVVAAPTALRLEHAEAGMMTTLRVNGG